MKTLILALAAVCLFLQPVHAEKGDIIPLKKTKPAKMVVPTITEEKLIAKKKKIEETEAKEGPYVASVGIYGTKRIDEAQLKQFLGKELDKWLQMGLKGDEASVDLEQKLAKKVKDHFGFYSADWSVIQFFESENQPIYIVLDVVEKEEVANRMPFLKNPTGEFKDPDGILKYWAEYENTALDMIEQGTLEPEVESCKGIAFHCPFGHKNEKLKKYQPVFVEGVKKNLNKLVQILQEDKRPEMRAAAAFV